jgi:hypothetical protein
VRIKKTLERHIYFKTLQCEQSFSVIYNAVQLVLSKIESNGFSDLYFQINGLCPKRIYHVLLTIITPWSDILNNLFIGLLSILQATFDFAVREGLRCPQDNGGRGIPRSASLRRPPCVGHSLTSAVSLIIIASGIVSKKIHLVYYIWIYV